MERYRKIFFKITERRTTAQMIARAFISPLGELMTSYKAALNLFTGFILARNDPGLEATLRVSSFLNISNRNGLKRARDMTENNEDKILKLK